MSDFLTKKICCSFIVITVLLFNGCTSYEYHETYSNQLLSVEQSQGELENINEDALLDIGIVLFNDGVDVNDDESLAYANVRRSEAVWYSSQLKSVLENSNAWGIVRTLPNDATVLDLTISGTIVESNGEDLTIQIDVVDAVGEQWLSKEYFKRVSQYAYNPEIDLKRDPFQNLFNDIANDLFALRNEFSEQELLTIREVARLRFAAGFAPQSFSDFVEKDDDGMYALKRIPADTDPMMMRVESIRARNDLFLDVIQDYYRVFNNNMSAPYDEWRKLSYKEVLYQRQLARQARQERIAGVAIILSGVVAATSNEGFATRAAGHVGIVGGADIFQKSYQTQQEASFHGEALREFGESLEVELEPSVIDLQERSVTLSGTVDDQFKEWRRILQQIFDAEQSTLDPLHNETNIQTLPSLLNSNGVNEDRNQQIESDGEL